MNIIDGVTRYGVTDQLLDKVSGKIPTNQVLEACQYLAPKLIEATHKVVIAAELVMGWLQEVAAVFNKAGLPIQWQTPTGFIVKQNYRNQPTKTISTFFGKQRIDLGFKTQSNKLYRRGQVNGIAPNFIHSMDASHLMKTINQCFKEGMTSFTCIHDSFGTHACDIDKLNRILRETFVEMYNQNVLEDFRNQALSQLPEELQCMIPPLPERGTLDITQVKDSKFFFS